MLVEGINASDNNGFYLLLLEHLLERVGLVDWDRRRAQLLEKAVVVRCADRVRFADGNNLTLGALDDAAYEHGGATASAYDGDASTEMRAWLGHGR